MSYYFRGVWKIINTHTDADLLLTDNEQNGSQASK